VVISLVLATYLGCGIFLAHAAGSPLLNVFGDVFPDTTYSSQLGLVIPLALQNLLEQSLQSFHCDDLEIRV